VISRQGWTSKTHGTHSSCVDSILRISILPPFSLCNQASAADHAQPLHPRRQAIKCVSSYCRPTHARGLRLKKLLNLRLGASPFDLCSGASLFDPRSGDLPFDLRSGALPFDPCSGASPFDLHSGASPFDPCSGASPFDLRSGASPFDPHLGASPFDPHSGASPFDLRSGASPFDLRSGAPPVDLHDSSKFVQHLKNFPRYRHTFQTILKV
jgi:hypothetical protein